MNHACLNTVSILLTVFEIFKSRAKWSTHQLIDSTMAENGCIINAVFQIKIMLWFISIFMTKNTALCIIFV